MRYHNITKDDMKNGDGLRVVLWVAGCSHHCPGCHNPVTWDCNDGLVFSQFIEDEETGEVQEFFEPEPLEEIEAELKKPWISGITLSGGDPLFKGNRETTGKLIKYLKEKNPDKTIWVYTGYELGDYFNFWSPEEVFSFEYLKYIDVLVDGRFQMETRKKDIEEGKVVNWRGSSNQRVIDVQASLASGKIVVREDI